MTHDERQAEIDAAQVTATDAVHAVREHVGDKPDRSEVTKIAILVAIIASVIMGGVAIGVSALAFSSASATAASQQAAEKDAASNKAIAQQAFEQATAANKALAARGQQTVPVPAPDADNASDSIVAAATARVLAQMPIHPTAAELGEGIARYMAANPVTPLGPTPAQVAAGAAVYLAQNPPSAGPPGASGQPGANGSNGANGQPGPAPTEDQIQNAFVDYVTAHPAILCTGASATPVAPTLIPDLRSVSGTTYTVYGCVVSTGTETPTPTSTPTGFP